MGRRRWSSSCGSCAPCCAPRARVIVLQPNIRLVGPRYWDFIDHRSPSPSGAWLEAAELAGLRAGRS